MTTIAIPDIQKEKGPSYSLFCSEEKASSVTMLAQKTSALLPHTTPRETFNDIKRAALSRHMEDTCSTNSCMCNMDNVLFLLAIFLLYHVDNKWPSSVSFLCLGKAMLSCVANSAFQTSFKRNEVT